MVSRRQVGASRIQQLEAEVRRLSDQLEVIQILRDLADACDLFIGCACNLKFLAVNQEAMQSSSKCEKSYFNHHHTPWHHAVSKTMGPLMLARKAKNFVALFV